MKNLVARYSLLAIAIHLLFRVRCFGTDAVQTAQQEIWQAVDANNAVQNALQGTWQATAIVDKGVPDSAYRVSNLKLRIKDNLYTLDLGKG